MGEVCAECGVEFRTAKGWKWNPETQEKEEVEYISEAIVIIGEDKYHPRCVHE